MKRHTKISIVGISIILICSTNFLSSPWNVIGTIEFIMTMFGTSYLMNKAEEKPNGN